eukprot:1136893-Pelagomonas_calceolata.AAC.2
MGLLLRSLTHKHTHVATYSRWRPQLTSPTEKANPIPREAQTSCTRRCLKTISNLVSTSQGHIFFYKVKSHAGIAGNECADRIAKYQASLKDNNLTDTSNPSVGPGSNAIYNIAWLAREEARPGTP